MVTWQNVLLNEKFSFGPPLDLGLENVVDLERENGTVKTSSTSYSSSHCPVDGGRMDEYLVEHNYEH